jgi:hypothetical protein
LYKYKEEYKQGGMLYSAERAEISEEMCMFQPGHCQAMGTCLISSETNNEELLIAGNSSVTMDILMAMWHAA